MSFDVIVIGAGHNGLTAAAVLARSGRKVLLLEAAAEVGGGARSHEFHPGFHAPLAHVINRLHPKVQKALQLDLPGTILPTVLGDGVSLHGGWGERIDGVSAGEAKAWAGMRQVLLTQAGVLKPFLARKAPALGRFSLADKAFLAGRALALRLKGRAVLEDFARMLLICVADVVEEYLGDPRLQALAAFDAVLGQNLGPRSPTSLLGLLYRLTGEAGGVAGAQMLAPGSVAAAFAAAALRAGVEIRVNAPVAKVLIEDHRVCGVVLADGSEIRARDAVSALAPQVTMLNLVGPSHLDAGLVRALGLLPVQGNVAKLHLALDRVPDIAPGRHVVADDLNQIERAFNPSKYGELTDVPVFEFVVDDKAAPQGAAVLSAAIPFAPYALKAGWENGRKALAKAVLGRLEQVAPTIGKSVLHAELLAPADVEERFGIAGGHWHHVEMSADRMLMLRPLHELAGYRSTIPGLTLCGAGTHPGGGISGIAGLNAARSVIAGDAA